MPTCGTHLGLVISDSGNLLAKSRPTQRPGQGEILISPLLVGICGTDLDIIRGVRPDTPTIPGHEGVGEVVEIGPGMIDFSVGQKVVFNPVNPDNQEEILGHTTQGLLQQRLLISRSAIERGLIVPFDTGVPLVCGPLVEPLGTVIYGQSLVGQVCRPRCIAIVGAGPIGLLHALYARAQGCPDIFLVHNSEQRLNWAVTRNVIKAEEAFLDSPELDVVLLDRTEGRGVDVVYLCTTRPSARDALKQALRYLRPGGTVDIVVGFSDGESIPELPGVDLNAIRRANVCGLPKTGVVARHHTADGKEVHLTGHRGTSKHHLEAAMASLREQPMRYASVITHVISLESAPLTLKHLVTARRRQIQGRECVKVILDFRIQGSAIETFQPAPFSLRDPYQTGQA